MATPREKALRSLVGCGVVFGLGLLVILAPTTFTFSEAPEGSVRHNQLVEIKNRLTKDGLDESINHVTNDYYRSSNRLDELNSRVPWMGETPRNLQRAIEDESSKFNSLSQERSSLIEAREALHRQMRALSPVFSQMAWDETQALFQKRQEHYLGVSTRMWKWDMMWNMMMGGMGRINDREDAAAAILGAILQLLWRLTFGTVMALIDFAISLPFWLTEYQLFSAEGFDEYGEEDVGDENVDVDGYIDNEAAGSYRKRRGKASSSNQEEEGEEGYGQEFEGRAVGSGGSWMSTLYALIFWCLAVTGSLVATVLLVAAIWSPLWIPALFLLGKAYYARRNERRHEHAD